MKLSKKPNKTISIPEKLAVESVTEKPPFEVLSLNKDVEEVLAKTIPKEEPEIKEIKTPIKEEELISRIDDLILMKLMESDPKLQETPLLLNVFIEVMKYRWLKKRKKVCQLTATINQITQSIYISEEDFAWLEKLSLNANTAENSQPT